MARRWAEQASARTCGASSDVQSVCPGALLRRTRSMWPVSAYSCTPPSRVHLCWNRLSLVTCDL
eukprot:4126159-Prymnesium_polylepis.2